MTLHFPIRLFNAKAAKKLAVLSVQPSSKHPGQQLLQVAKGASREALTDVQLLGPFTPEALEPAAQQLVDALMSQGYSASGASSASAALSSGNPKTRALAALSLGWRGDTAAVPKLIEVAGRAKQDVSSAVDALGLLQAARGVAVVKAEAERKLLSRRRAGAEALRASADVDAMAGVTARALERLETPFRTVLQAQSAQVVTANGVSAVIEAFDALPAGDRGATLDALYEVGTPLAVAATRALLRRHETVKDELARLGRPNFWRYAKSVWKRSMLRFDFETFALLTLAVERLGRTYKGEKKSLKSGLDGETRDVKVFSKKTVRYVQGRAWRYVKRIAAHRSSSFTDVAVAVLAVYRPEDDALPKGAHGATSRLYLLHRLLLGRSNRFELQWRTLTHRFKNSKVVGAPAGVREDAYPELWDATPVAYVRLLGTARRLDVMHFALTALKGRASGALAQAPHADVVQLLDSDFNDVVGLAVQELARRFNPTAPDWDLIAALGKHGSARPRELAQQWLRVTASSWTRVPSLLTRFFTTLHPQVSAELPAVARAGVPLLSAGERREVAGALLTFVQSPEHADGAHTGAADLLTTALLDDATALMDLQTALKMLLMPSIGASAVGAAVMGKLPNVLETLGWARIAAMARDEKVAMRAAALSIVRTNAKAMVKNASLLFEMVESDWDDVRAVALEVLTGFSFDELTFDGLVALLDSPRVDVQNAALVRLKASFEHVDTQALLSRLAQHPHPNMRAHVLELVEAHLKPGFVQLSKVEPLMRALLFDAARPSRPLKRRAITFLEQRGQLDAQQAEVAERVLADAVRTETRADRERMLQALARLQLAFPEVKVHNAPTVGGLR